MKQHLDNVSRLAGEFSSAFDAELHARRIGLLHDAGKYSPAGQRRMRDPEHTNKVDHATAGAKIALERCKDGIGALAIAGHHGGMPDYGSRGSSQSDGTLLGRMRKKLMGDLDYSPFWEENAIEGGILQPSWVFDRDRPFAIQFYTRMLFSGLVDADFLDTEHFIRGERSRGGRDSMETLLDRLKIFIQPWLDHPSKLIDQKRCEILADCMEVGKGDRALYTLTVPTGGGKTVSSLAFALTHATIHRMKRVIYVIPYTSIIEQNAAVFKRILGEDNVIEHHSGIEYDSDEDMEKPENMRKMLAAENWDAPVIVTTAVQFFESLFSNRPSRCRKLHNIVDSVVIFDEAQMLPMSHLRPCVCAIAELVRHYRVTAVLCTATQPSLGKLFSEYDRRLVSREICRDVDVLQALFRRVHFVRAGATDVDTLALRLATKRQVLCVVNTRKTAQSVFALLPETGSYHLSTRMTPDHRSRVLNEIRNRLKDGKECRVVSTSLIEAGVDVDFPEVWRELAGLDSILQAAGRCNREGKKVADDSPVVVFSLPGGVPKGMQPNAVAAEAAMQGTDHLDDIGTIRRYFEHLYWQLGKQAQDARDIMKLCATLDMRAINNAFEMIESNTHTIYIPTAENAGDIELLKMGLVTRSLLRRLGRSTVSVNPWDWQNFLVTGVIDVVTEGVAILADISVYDSKCGLKTDVESGRGLWI